LAWVGVVAIVGLVLCGLDAWHERRRARHADSPDPGRPWWQRRGFVFGGVASVLLLAVVVAAVVVLGASTTAPKITAPPTTTSTAGATTTTTTPNRGRAPQLVHVEVINASGVPKAAAMKAAALMTLGYPVVGTANAAGRQGTIVECKAGFDAEAIALARAVGPTTTVQPFPTPAPAGSPTADCVVVLGQ
jgi:hypothetical protein